MRLRYSWISVGDYKRHGNDLRRRAWLIGHEQDHDNRYNNYLCGVLTSDFQTTKNCQATLDAIDQVEAGTREMSEDWGNAFRITVKRDGVRIEFQTSKRWTDVIPEDWMETFTIAEFKTALKGWKQFLELPAVLDMKVEVDLPT